MSQHLDSLAIGDTIEVRGPAGDIEYKGRGLLTAAAGQKTLRVSCINMIAGGTGITPMYQLIKVRQEGKGFLQVLLW